MGKRKKKDDLKVSLFPFLSILACVLGILTLMITAIVIAQIDPQAVNEKIEDALAEDQEFQQKMAAQRAEIDKLRQEVEQVRRSPAKPIDPARKDQLLQQIKQTENQAKQAQELRKDIQDVTKKRDDAKAQVAAVTTSLANATEEWDQKKDPSKFATMVVKPSGSGAGGELEPTFVECREEGLVAYGKDGKSAFKVKKAEIPKHQGLKNFVRKIASEAPFRFWRAKDGRKLEAAFVKNQGTAFILRDKKGNQFPVSRFQLSYASVAAGLKIEQARKDKRPEPTTRYLIFLIRDKGFSTWAAAAKLCDANGCKNGRLPLDGEGELDLSLFAHPPPDSLP